MGEQKAIELFQSILGIVQPGDVPPELLDGPHVEIPSDEEEAAKAEEAPAEQAAEAKEGEEGAEAEKKPEHEGIPEELLAKKSNLSKDQEEKIALKELGVEENRKPKLIDMSDRISIANFMSEKSTELRIGCGLRKDRGRYLVVAENPLGIHRSIVEVNIIDIPSVCQEPWLYKDPTKTSITLEWGAPDDDGGCDITGYHLQRRERGKRSWSSVQQGINATSYKVTNLIENKDYVFRVAAENKLGSGPWLWSRPITIKLPYDPPSAPKKPVVIDVTKKSCTIKWRPPFSGGSPITGYYIEKKDVKMRRWIQMNEGLPIERLEYKIPEDFLITGQEYQIRIIAENDAGLSEPSEPSAPFIMEDPIFLPSEPEVEVTDTTKSSIQLEWSEPTSDGGDPNGVKYIIEQLLEGGNWSQVNDKPIKDRKYIIDNLADNALYSFRVRA